MLSDKEKKIIQALVEEEIVCINSANPINEDLSRLLGNYCQTLKDILSKLSLEESFTESTQYTSRVTCKLV